MKIVAKDDDEPGTPNTKISYSILSQEPAGNGHMFTINRHTGEVYVKEPTLDREVRLQPFLKVCCMTSKTIVLLSEEDMWYFHIGNSLNV